jgi:hypothetical protein
MASAFCTAYLKPLLVSPCPAPQHERTIAARLNSDRPTLGVLCPEATPETDRQIATFGRIFLRAEIDVWIVVLGLCADELGIMARSDTTASFAEELQSNRQRLIASVPKNA